MPRVRPLETYPYRQFMAVFTKVAASREPFLIPCTRPQAASLRGELYAFRRACEGQPGAAQAMGIELDTLRDVAFRIVADGLEACHQSALVGPSLIERALGAEAPPMKTAAQIALDKIKAMGIGAEGPTEP
jgi:hypothetical protein